MNTKLIAKVGLIGVFFLSAPSILNAQTCQPLCPGALDPTFGSGGKATYQIPDAFPFYPEGMAVQSDGKVLAVVGFRTEHLVRLNVDGSLDETFGTGGVTNFTWALGTSNGNALAVAVQNVAGEERIIVGGFGPMQSGRNIVGSMHLTRFLSNGSIDVSFGNNGDSLIYTGGYASKILVQQDGKIVTVGVDTGKLVRLNVNGTLDTTFGSGGIVSIYASRAMAIDANGGILVGGSTTTGKGNKARSLMTVMRYTPSGSLDTAFGIGGTATADFGASSQTWNLAIDTLGNIVSTGTVGSSAAAARFTSNGIPDASFGGNGRALFAGPGGLGRGLVMQPDNKIVMTGNTNNDFGLVRFKFNGSVDSEFGSGGFMVVDVSGSDLSDNSVLQMDPFCACPKIVMGGGSSGVTSFARFLVQ